jgi:acetyl-CoA C-acetyltransferase
VAEIVILSAARTPIGRFGGAFRNTHPAELGAIAVRGALERAGLAPPEPPSRAAGPATNRSVVDELIFGQARQAGSGPNPARQVVRRAGLPDEVPARTVNQACASGMLAVADAARAIALGECRLVAAGGMESMSRMPFLVDAEDARWGHKAGSFTFVDAMYRDGFACPLSNLIMGETAEVLARERGITREASDAFALRSQQKTARAVAEGRFADEIAPVGSLSPRGRGEGEGKTITADEHPRPDTTAESLARLPLTFPNVEGAPGIITAGSASGITDGAAALLLASEAHARSLGVAPMARIIGWASAGVDPRIMGIGPVPAVRELCERTALQVDEFDLVELNEAFAPQVLAVLQDLPIDPERLNVNGGAIALGHPIGCTGARLLVTLVHELRRRRLRRGLAALCVSGGLGMAMAIEV